MINSNLIKKKVIAEAVIHKNFSFKKLYDFLKNELDLTEQEINQFLLLNNYTVQEIKRLKIQFKINNKDS